jgi:hypothetical protein
MKVQTMQQTRDQLIRDLYLELALWRNIQIDIRNGRPTAICGLVAQEVQSTEEFRQFAQNLPSGLVS